MGDQMIVRDRVRVTRVGDRLSVIEDSERFPSWRLGDYNTQFVTSCVTDSINRKWLEKSECEQEEMVH